MHAPSPAIRTAVERQRYIPSDEAELVRLREQVAWLQAERAALWWAVGHDELTGLANRRLFCTLAPPLLRSARSGVVVALDLNHFKPINDTFGHDTGDRVLQTVAQRLAAARFDLVARLGGDEFTAVLTSAHREAPVHWWQPVVTALATAIAEPMPVSQRMLRVTASIGVAAARDSVPIGELLRRADLAMYHAKVSGGCYAAWGRQAAVRDPVPRDRRPPHAPTCNPYLREPADIAPADTYRRHDPIWVHRDGAWRPGVVESASARAVMATYRQADGIGTVVDTMTAEYVLARTAADAQLDRVSDAGAAA